MRLAVLFVLMAAGVMVAREVAHITPPKVIYKAEPEYTNEAIAAKISGTVTVKFTVGADGIPSNPQVVRGLGSGLDENAVECVQKWRFTTATRDGAPVSVNATAEVNFRLPERTGRSSVVRG
jgi:protein TonB